MGQITVRGPDGLLRQFLIDGDQPTADDNAAIQAALNPAPKTEQEAPKDQAGILATFGQGVKSGAYQTAGGIAGILEGMGNIHTPEMDMLGIDAPYWQQKRHELNKTAQEVAPDLGTWEEANGAYDTTRFLAGQLGNSAVSTGAGLAALAIPGVGPVAGAALMGATSFPQMFNENLKVQEEEYGKVNDWTKAVGGTAVSSALEGIADRITLGATGLLTKSLPGNVKANLAAATKSAFATVAKKVGEGAATGLIAEGGTEAVQQAITRWQADKPLGGDEAMKEYIENAIVGGLLGASMGGAGGAAGGVKTVRDRAAFGEAIKDVDAEKAALSQAPVNAANRMASREKIAQAELNQENASPIAPAILPSPVRVSSYADEKAQMRASEVGTTTAIGQVPKSDAFTDDEYIKALDAMRGEKLVSQEKVKGALGLGRKKGDGEKAAAIMKAMMERQDAKPSGSAGQYLTVVEKKSGPVSADTEGRTYEVQPVEKAPSYQVRVGKRKVGELFNTADEAADFAASTGIDKRPDYSIETNPTTSTYGVYERGTINGKPVNRLVNSFGTKDEADTHAYGLDPNYSPKTNQIKQDQALRDRIDQKTKEALGPLEEKVTAFADKLTGGRAKVKVSSTIDPAEYGKGPGTVIEGLATQDKAGGHLIRVAGEIFDPAVSPEEQAQKMNEVIGHEAVHTLRSADVLQEKEWNGLTDMLSNQKVPGKRYTWLQLAAARNEGNNLSSGQLVEEGIAEMVRAHIKNPTLLENKSRSLIQKIVDFIKALGRFGQTPRGQQVIKDILSGDIGKRETGSGGLGTRENMYGPYYSSVNIPGFYLKSSKYFEGVASKNPEQAYPGPQWASMYANAGIKEEERKWLGVEDWLRGQKGKVPVRDILQYIGANSLDIKQRTNRSGDWEETNNWKQTRDVLEETGRSLREELYAQYEADFGYTSLDDFIDFQAENGNTKAEEYKDIEARLDKHLNQDDPRVYHEDTTQDGGTDYTELAIHMPHLRAAAGGKFNVESHLGGLENVIAHARFKTRDINGLKTLAVEEIQSDLHQQAGKVGYYSESDMPRWQELANQLNTLRDALRVKVRDRDEAFGIYRELKKADDPLYKDAENEYEAIAKEVRELSLQGTRIKNAFNEVDERMKIPDAPFKNTWDQLALKALVKHAVDNDFDAISWNASPEGVAQTEQHKPYVEYQKEDGTTGYRIEYKDGDQTVYSQDMTGIVNFYTKKMRNLLSNMFGKKDWGFAAPEFVPAAKEAEPTPRSLDDRIKEAFADKFEFEMGMGAIGQEFPGLRKRAMKAVNIANYQRTFDAKLALEKAFGDKVPEVMGMIEGLNNLEEYYGSSEDQDPNVDRWIMKITPEMKGRVDDEGQPLFSAVDTTVQYSATAPLGQRVPPRPPVDKIEEINQQLRYNVMAPKVKKLLDTLRLSGTLEFFGKSETAETKIENTFIYLQDRMLSLGKFVDRVKDNGGFISNENDTYLQQQLMSGQVDYNLRAADKDYYQPLADVVHGLGITNDDVTALKNHFGNQGHIPEILNQYAQGSRDHPASPNQAMAELYLYAQHAQERNAMMRKRNDAIFQKTGERLEQWDLGSGMSDAEAQEVLKYINQRWASKFSDLANPKSVRSLYRALIAHTNNVRVAGDLTPDWKNMRRSDGTPIDPYQDYAPLRGWLDSNMDRPLDDIDNAMARTGKGVSIKGKEDFSATGRGSLASNLLATAILQNQEAIVRAGKNKVAQSFHRLIAQNMSVQVEPGRFGRSFAEVVSDQKLKPVYDKTTGVVRMQSTSRRMDPDILSVKYGDREVRIQIKDKRIREAMMENSSLGEAGQVALIRGLLQLNRFMAAVRTSYNPEFMLPNFMRDLGAALVNLNEFDLQSLKGDILKSLPGSLGGIRQAIRSGDFSSEWAKAFDEFDKRGGKTSFMGLHDLESSMKKFANKMAQDNSGGALNKSKEAVGSIFQFMSDYNEVVENGIRVATYKNVKEKLLASTQNPNDPVNIRKAQDTAAYVAKNLTINFNMGGKGKPMLNALYLFYNASMQGSAALLNPMLRSKKVRRIWMAAVAGGVMQDILMSAISPEDDDGKKVYDNIRDQTLESNIILIDPFGFTDKGFIQIPMPYLFNSAWNMGRALTKYARGAEELDKTANTVFGTLASTVNPWGSGGSGWLNTVAPSVIDPMVDLYTNTNFAGVPIRPAESPYGVPEIPAQKYWNNTNPIYVTIADWMDKLTGGDDVLAGSASFSPNQYEYVFEFLGGGAWSTLARGAGLLPEPFGSGNAGKIMSGEADLNDIPFVRRLMGNISDKQDLSKYVEDRNRVQQVRAAMKDALQAGDTAKYQQIMQDYPLEYKLAAQVNAIDSRRKKLSAQINKIKDNARIPDAQKKTMVDALKKQQEALVKQGISAMGDM